jgi:uncharacterized protein (DUF433 family)
VTSVTVSRGADTKDVLVAADPRTGAPVSSAQMSREPRGGHPIETDPRFDVGLYSLPEAARLTRVPRQTLRNWVSGYDYPRSGGRVKAPPVIHSTARDTPAALSFVNLIEALALSGFREMGVPLQRVRLALEFAGGSLGVQHLLASERILSDGLDLFWEFQERSHEAPGLVNMSRGGQRVFPDAVRRYLREVEWAKDSFAVRWWPGAQATEGFVVVDPQRGFGAPVLVGTGIKTEDVWSRFSAGESIRDLAEDYRLSVTQIESALRLEAVLLEPIAA